MKISDKQNKVWKTITIGDGFKFSGGSQPAKKHFVYQNKPGYIRLLQTRDFKTDDHETYIPEKLANKKCNKDDIIIGRYGPPLFQVFRGKEGAYNVALIKAIPNEKIINKDYAFYFLSQRDLRDYLEGLSQRSGGQTGIEMDKLLKYPLVLPPIDKQKEIVDILSTWDETLYHLDELIFKSKKKRKSANRRLLFGINRLDLDKEKNNYLKSKYFSYPSDWKLVSIANIAQESKERNGHKNITVLSCTKYNGLVDSLDYFGKQVFSDDLSNYKVVKNGEFAYATNHIEEGSIGYQDFIEHGLVSPMYTVFSVNSKLVNSYFLYYLLKTSLFIHIYGNMTSGTVNRRGSLRWKEFSKIKIALPTIREQNQIVEIISHIDEEINLLENKKRLILKQKKGLMQRLLTGKVRLS